MLNKCSADVHLTCRKAPTKVGLVLINYFWEHLPVSFWSRNKKTYSKQIACQEDECSRSVWLLFPRLYFGRFPCRLLMHRCACTCTHTAVANYRKCDEVSHATFASNALLYSLYFPTNLHGSCGVSTKYPWQQPVGPNSQAYTSTQCKPALQKCQTDVTNKTAERSIKFENKAKFK